MKFEDLFPKKPIIGMIHLAGDNSSDRIRRALDELIIYDEEGIAGAIIENYHGTREDVFETLKESSSLELEIVRGINILGNPYDAFSLARDFGAKFVQFDSVQTPDLALDLYDGLRKKYSDIVVLGGIGFKYTRATGNPLRVDLKDGMSRCEAIVTTGSGTGIETPVEKLREYKKLLGDFPLIVGAGVNESNLVEQIETCDGAIIGSSLKYGSETWNQVSRERCRSMTGILSGIKR